MEVAKLGRSQAIGIPQPIDAVSKVKMTNCLTNNAMVEADKPRGSGNTPQIPMGSPPTPLHCQFPGWESLNNRGKITAKCFVTAWFHLDVIKAAMGLEKSSS